MTRPIILIRLPQDAAALPAACAAIRAMAGQIAEVAYAESVSNRQKLSDVVLDLEGLAAQIEAHISDMEKVPDPDGGRAFFARAALLLGQITGNLVTFCQRAGIDVHLDAKP